MRRSRTRVVRKRANRVSSVNRKTRTNRAKRASVNTRSARKSTRRTAPVINPRVNRRKSRGRIASRRAYAGNCPPGQTMNMNGQCVGTQGATGYNVPMPGNSNAGYTPTGYRRKSNSRVVSRRGRNSMASRNKLSAKAYNTERKQNAFRVKHTLFGYEVKNK